MVVVADFDYWDLRGRWGLRWRERRGSGWGGRWSWRRSWRGFFLGLSGGLATCFEAVAVFVIRAGGVAAAGSIGYGDDV